MATYSITATQSAFYDVKAETEAEAIQLVEDWVELPWAFSNTEVRDRISCVDTSPVEVEVEGVEA